MNMRENVEAWRMGQSFAADPDLSLPERPCLISELLVLPIDDDGLLFVGAEEPQLLRGRSARGKLVRLLPLLDGTATLSEIAVAHPTFSLRQLHDMVALLFSRGLLEDGPGIQAPADLADTAAFVGRHIDVTRRHSGRAEALRSLAEANVRISGHPAFAEALAEELRAAGLRDIRTGEDDRAAPASLTICVSTGATEDRPAFPAGAGARLMLVRLGAGEAQIGPLLIEGVTACPACVAAAHPHPPGDPDAIAAAFWIGLAASQAFAVLAGLAAGPAMRGFRAIRFEQGELAEEMRLPVRLPGCPQCRIDGAPWPADDPRLIPWIYHCGTSLLSRDLLSPKDHQQHYRVANTRLAGEERRLMESGEPSPLPPAAEGGAPSGTLDAATLAGLLARTAGKIGTASGPRRLVPTGGNLGSVALWVIVREVAGLAPGTYVYDAARHALDRAGGIDEPALAAMLRIDGPLPPALIVGTGALAKCAQKYQAFAYRLIHFDAGVALAFAHFAADALGLALREIPGFDLDIMSMWGVAPRWEFPVPTFVAAISEATRPMGFTRQAAPGGRAITPSRLKPEDHCLDLLPRLLDEVAASPFYPAPGPMPQAVRPQWVETTERLDAVLRTRRAVRDYAPLPVARAAASGVLAAAEAMLAGRGGGCATTRFVRPVLGIARAASGEASGLFARDEGRLVRFGDFDPARSAACSNQLSLGAAPATVFTTVDLRRALTEHGARGYVEVAIDAGAAIGAAWLEAVARGLAGTAAGGVVAMGLREAAGMDGFNQCPLLALHFGHPLSRDRA